MNQKNEILEKVQQDINARNGDIQNIHLTFAIDRVNYNFWKKIIFGMMGGIFAGLGYIAFNFLNGGSYESIGGELVFTPDFPETGFFFGALLFPVGIMMCLFLGGNLFTSNVLVVMGVFAKKVKVKLFVFDLLITLLGNIMGGIIIALLAFGSSLYWTYEPSTGFEINNIGWGVVHIASKKISTEWWSNILSAILCNMIVAGSIYAYVKIESRTLGASLVYFFIVVFGICGFQHVVANTFIFVEAALMHTIDTNNAQIVDQLYGNMAMWETVYINMIPTIFGNILGGIFISGIYMFVESEKVKRGFKKTTNVIVSNEDGSISRK